VLIVQAPHDAADDSLVDEFVPVDEIRLTTVGIDIGSATSHFLLSRLTLRRLGAAMMSRYEVVDKRELHRSDILLTPYVSSTEIDADALRAFFDDRLRRSGLSHDDIDTGVVMLTGEAARKQNARAIAALFAASMGRFVCTSAGHHLEARMAAQGSGAVLASRTEGRIANVDVGGGTTKVALVSDGRILGTAALNIGGRLVALEDGVVARIDAAASRVAQELGLELVLGAPLPEGADRRLAGALADCVVEFLTKSPPYSPLTEALLLTPPLADLAGVQTVTLSGGVCEYLVAPDDPTHDLGRDLAHELVARAAAAGLQVRPATERMRATVVGLSQFTTQVSGDTVYVSDPSTLPLTNLPVVWADLEQLGDTYSADEVSGTLRRALEESGRLDLHDTVVLNLGWSGTPYYHRLATLAEGIVEAARSSLPVGPLVVVVSQDCARSLGHVLHEVVGQERDVVCIDGLRLRENDFIDVGELVQRDSVLPVVVKTLVFPDAAEQTGVIL
jgi:ethanolamine utilization protein EutA